MESRMEVRKSESARCGSTSSRSGDDGGRRGYRYPSGLHRHWPSTERADRVGEVVVVVLGCFPSASRSLGSVGFL